MTKSFDLYGKAWVLPNGKCVDVSCSEHALYARAAMLCINADDIHREIPLNTIFKPLNKDQVLLHLERGIGAEVVGFLCSDPEMVDPRVYVIKNKKWIRQSEGNFYAWRWDEATLSILSKCDDFWKSQNRVTGKSWVTLWNVADEGYIAGSLCGLLERFAEKKP